jgi:D-alanyl-D-alanine carboxypeptidase (penicillin-binding protein 5/6)
MHAAARDLSEMSRDGALGVPFARWAASAFAAFALMLLTVAPSRAEQPFSTSVPSAILIDADSGAILFEKNADTPEIPASTAKIMTLELIFEALGGGHLKLTDTLNVSENAWRTGGAMARGSTMFAALHSNISVEDLIRGIAVVSANDASIVLAEGTAGSEGAFATRMTERAHELGLAHSTFTNPWGQDDPDQRTTARDMATLATYMIKNYPQYYHYFADKDFTWNKIKQPNRNPLLEMDLGADGLKTGNIGDSGYGIVASAVQNGQRLVLAIYGAKTAKERETEAARIFQWGFRSFEAKTLFKAGEVIGYADVFGGSTGYVPLVSEKPVRLLIPRESDEKLHGQIVYTGPLVAPVASGREIAQLRVFRGASQILDTPLKTAANVGVGSLSRRAMDAGIEYTEEMFRKYVLKK